MAKPPKFKSRLKKDFGLSDQEYQQLGTVVDGIQYLEKTGDHVYKNPGVSMRKYAKRGLEDLGKSVLGGGLVDDVTQFFSGDKANVGVYNINQEAINSLPQSYRKLDPVLNSTNTAQAIVAQHYRRALDETGDPKAAWQIAASAFNKGYGNKEEDTGAIADYYRGQTSYYGQHATEDMKNKPKYNPGGVLPFLNQNGAAIGGGVQQALTAIAPESAAAGVAGSTLGMAGQGFAIGGPVGGAIGGAIGLTSGLLQQKKLKEEEEKQEKMIINARAQNILGQSRINLSGFDTQGKGNFAKGGKLKPISNQAVEVDAFSSGTDTVDIGHAMVDNNEVISGDKVYSDDLIYKGKTSFAKEAKRLEKMKDDKYPKMNTHIDNRLATLFEMQQQLNGRKGEGLKYGGKLNYNPGGVLPEKLDRKGFGLSPSRLANPDDYLGEGVDVPQFSPATKGAGQWDPEFQSSPLSQVARYGSNVLNAMQIERTPEPAIPELQSTVGLERLSNRDMIADTRRQGSLARSAVNRNTRQSAAASSRNAAIRAQEIQETNRIEGDTRRNNAQISNREAMINAGIQGRNTQLMNQYRQSRVDRKIAMANLRSQNFADVATKIGLQQGEKNRFNLDKFRARILGKAYEDTGLDQRYLYESLTDQYGK